jgi:hypothetical protein
MRIRLLLGLLICCLASCTESYSERVVHYLSVRDVLIQRMLQVYAETGFALETDNRYPGPAANGLQDSFLVGIKGPLKITSTFRRKQAETSVEVRVSQTGAGLSREALDKIRDEFIGRFEAKMGMH